MRMLGQRAPIGLRNAGAKLLDLGRQTRQQDVQQLASEIGVSACACECSGGISRGQAVAFGALIDHRYRRPKKVATKPLLYR
jgi:hypothetical protein